MIRQQLTGAEQVHIDYALLRAQIDALLPAQRSEYISHAMLRAKLSILRADMLWLLDAMDDSTHPYVRLLSPDFTISHLHSLTV